MKKFVTLMLALVAFATAANAEGVIIGDRLPDMRISSWLMDMQPDEADYTCILFCHSESPLCSKCIKHVKRLINNYKPNFNIIIITKEAYSSAGVSLTEHLADNTGIAFDDKGRTFRSFRVKFIPFCVISNDKRRAVWCGNGAALTEQIIETILTTKTK